MPQLLVSRLSGQGLFFVAAYYDDDLGERLEYEVFGNDDAAAAWLEAHTDAKETAIATSTLGAKQMATFEDRLTELENWRKQVEQQAAPPPPQNPPVNDIVEGHEDPPGPTELSTNPLAFEWQFGEEDFLWPRREGDEGLPVRVRVRKAPLLEDAPEGSGLIYTKASVGKYKVWLKEVEEYLPAQPNQHIESGVQTGTEQTNTKVARTNMYRKATDYFPPALVTISE